MKKYAIDFNLMEMTELVCAIKYALGKEHDHFLQIFEWNVKGIDALRKAREKILAALSEDSCHVELELMEIIQLYSACNMAWHHEKDAMEREHVEWRAARYARAVQDLEYAREKILAAINS
jgi:hypothetical protein